MKIEIKNKNSKAVSKLLVKFLELNNNGDYDYLSKDTLFIGYNENSGFSYIYLESCPSISLCLDNNDEMCIIYSSGLDGIEFIRYALDNIKNLSKLEDLMNNIYSLEDEIRGNDYKNESLKDDFIEKMVSMKWHEL